VSLFLAESNTDQFHERLLIATTSELHHIAQRTVDTQRRMSPSSGCLTSAPPTNA
jgi:hypothetical protein